jgi:hypothetical protein
VSDHLITPPPQLIRHWRAELPAGVFDGYKYPQRETELCIQAAQWGADQELAACCEVLARELYCDGKHVATDLRMHRRPEPPSLKKQALTALHAVAIGVNDTREQHQDLDTIRKALEALPDE